MPRAPFALQVSYDRSTLFKVIAFQIYVKVSWVRAFNRSKVMLRGVGLVSIDSPKTTLDLRL